MNNFYLQKNTEINGKILKNIINATKRNNELNRFENLFDYYANSRRITDKFNHEVITRTGFAKYIVRLTVGYLIGKAVEYQATEGLDITPILDSYKKQTISRLDSRLAKDCAIYGKAYEMVYLNEEAQIRSVKVDVRNAILVRDSSVEHRKLFGLVYEPVFDDEGRAKANHFNLTILYPDRVEIRTLNDGNLSEPTETHTHYFGEVPLIEYINNDEMSGSFEEVLSDIDAYNILKSDRLNDRRKLADALLAISGARLKSEDKESLMNEMVALLPEGAKMEYISKNTDETGTDILRRNVNDDIHKVAMVPDMTDQNFIGNSSGVALAYKLLPFMMNSTDKERYFEESLLERFRIYAKFFNTKAQMSEISTDDVDVIFKHNLPKNDLETSQIINTLSGLGLVDKETLVAQLSFVQNAEEIVELARQETDMKVIKAGNDFGNQPKNPNDEDVDEK